MKVEFTSTALQLLPETPLETAFLRDTLGLRAPGDQVPLTLVRDDYYPLIGCGHTEFALHAGAARPAHLEHRPTNLFGGSKAVEVPPPAAPEEGEDAGEQP